MKKITFFAIILLHISCLVWAQESQVDYTKMIREITEQHVLEMASANREIDSLKTLSNNFEAQLADSTKRIISLSKEVLRLTSQLESQREANAKLELKKAEIVKPYEDKIVSLEATITTRDSMLSSCSSQIAALQESEDRFKTDNASLKRQLQDLQSFRQIYVRTKVEDEKPYVDLPYSQIDLNHLSEVIALCEQLKGNELNALSELFTAAKDRKIKYDLYVSSINRPYNQETIDELLKDKQQMIDASNSVQQAELTPIISSMESYKDANTAFVEIVKQISNYMNDFRQEGYDVTSAKEGAEYYLSSGRVTYFFNKFSQIPYLVDLFERYKEDLLNNPTSAPQIESEILNK